MKIHWIITGITAIQVPLQNTKEKVAIIGSGVAGACTAHFLQKLKDVDITVYEREDRIGGRVKSLDLFLPGLEYAELGGTLISTSNRYLLEAVSEFKLEKQDLETDQKSAFGVWNGKTWSYYHDTRYGDWFASLKMLYKYGLWHGPIQVKNLAKKVGDMFTLIYEHLDRRETWTRVEKEIEKLDLLDYSKESCPSFFIRQGINPEYVYDIVESITRNIYVSEIKDLHAMGCLLSVYAVSFDTFRIKGGNRLLYEAMLRGKRVELNTQVVRIEKLAKGFLVESRKGLVPSIEYFDHVVMAAPFPDSHIQLVGFDYEKLPKTRYRKVYVTVVYGRINASHFGLQNELEIPTALLTTNSTTSFNCITVIKSMNETHSVSKIFSKEPMKESELNELYVERIQTWTHAWDQPGAYPFLNAKEYWHLPTNIQGLWYVNSMEYWLSTQESEAIQARNVAFQIAGQ